MKAFVIEDKNTSYFTQIDEPILDGDFSVKVRVESVGICGTDIKIFEGTHSQSIGEKRIPGHEFAGVVVEVGSKVQNFKVNDRVVHEPINYCGTCYACKNNQGNVCKTLKVTGCNMSGGMQEYFVADEKQWHKLPDWIDWNMAALIEPYTIAAQICSQAQVQANDTMLIHGAGPIGLLLADTAKHMGLTVIISEVIDGRLKLAQMIGVPHIIDAKAQDVESEVMRITNGEGPNIVCDCAGIPSLAQQAFKILSPAGRFVPVAGVKFECDGYMAMRKQLKIVASRLQMNKFVPVLARFKLYENTAKLIITDVYNFSDSKKAFEHAHKRDAKTGKIIIRFNNY